MYTLAKLTHHLDGCLHDYAEQPIYGIASLSRATPTDLSYFDNPTLLKLFIGEAVFLGDGVQAATNLMRAKV